MSHSDHVAESLKTLVDLDFEKTSLDNVLAYLSEVVPGLNIVIDPDIELAGIDLSTRVVDLKVKAVSVETVLGLVLGFDLGYRIRSNHVLVTPVERLHDGLETRDFDVAELVNRIAGSAGNLDYAGEKLRDLVQRTVNNISDRHVAVWGDEGGPASIEFLDGRLIVTQTEQGFRKIAHLLERLCERPSVAVEPVPTKGTGSTRIGATGQPSKVFIGHGRDVGAKEETARFLEKLGLSTVVIGEQGRGMSSLMESVERSASSSDFAVLLLTPDDLGMARGRIEAAESNAAKIECLEPRARQNVVFELGYLAGVLGRDRVCALRKGGFVIFSELSDMHGVFCPEMDAAGGWKDNLARTLKKAGFEIDLNRLAD